MNKSLTLILCLASLGLTSSAFASTSNNIESTGINVYPEAGLMIEVTSPTIAKKAVYHTPPSSLR